MNDKELQKTLQQMDDHTQKVTSSPEVAQAFLQRAGVINAGGDLTEPYQQPHAHKLSFILPSRNNLKYLKWCYAAIRKNQSISHEICMADDASTDGTWEWILEMKKSDHDIIAIRNVSGARMGHTILYDQLIQRATSDVVMIWHADMYFCPGADIEVSRLIAPQTIVSLTRIEPSLHPAGPEKIQKDFGVEPEQFDEDGLLSFAQKVALDQNPATVGAFAPWAIYKQDFLMLGGHDPLFAPQSKEDSDFYNRAAIVGFKFVQTWQGLCYHLTCRGSRFNPTLTTPGKNSSEWDQQNYRSGREFIRKWGTFPLHDKYMKPILAPLLNMACYLNNATDQWLAIVEPFFRAVYCDLPINNVEQYIAQEQPISRFDIQHRVLPDINAKWDVVVAIDCNDWHSEQEWVNCMIELIFYLEQAQPRCNTIHNMQVQVFVLPSNHVNDNARRTWSCLIAGLNEKLISA